jgi:hypothetical protein
MHAPPSISLRTRRPLTATQAAIEHTGAPAGGASAGASPRARLVRVPTVALVGLVALGAFLRLWHLGARRLGFDEAFTAMTARRDPASMFGFLRIADSHPPLSYLIRSPLADLGVSDFWMRFESATFSIAALAAFAYWMRRRGTAGLLATALFAVSTFEVVHGRDIRLYAELELIGVLVAITAESWIRRPRRWQPYAIGVLTFLGLMTHVSMFLLGAGLLLVPGRKTDREAWRWRAALAIGLVGWALTWGPYFVKQAQTGHSDWIPRTSLPRFVHVVGGLATNVNAWQLVALFAVIGGGVGLWRRDRVMGRVWVACFATPVALAALTGLFAPVLIDRALTMMSWGAPFAVAIALDAVVGHVTRLAPLAVVILVIVLGTPATIARMTARSGPDTFVPHLEHVARPGDVVAVHSARRIPEIAWPFEVTLDRTVRDVRVPGIVNTAAFELGTGPPSGRVWVLDWSRTRTAADRLPRCAPDWHAKGSRARVRCLAIPTTPNAT